MPHGTRKRFAPSCAALASVLVIALVASAPAADYKLTVNKDRLINAQNEPQNWLMMNGDYGSTPLFEAHPDQPRQRQEPAAWCGRWRSAACRTSARTGRRTRSIR